MLVHEHALVKIDRDMPLDRAALIGCAVITGYGAVVHTAKVEPGCSVAVAAAAASGCRPSTRRRLPARRASSPSTPTRSS
jgi:Zn-dependent alcohol dehydrogenase